MLANTSPFVRYGSIVGLIMVFATTLSACSTEEIVLPDNSSPATTGAVAVAPCATTDLNVSLTDEISVDASRVLQFRLENKSESDCSIQGVPGVQVRDADEQVITNAVAVDEDVAGLVNLTPNQAAYFEARYPIPSSTPDCVAADELAVTPPGSDEQLLLPLTNITINSICAETDLTVSPVAATPGPAFS